MGWDAHSVVKLALSKNLKARIVNKHLRKVFEDIAEEVKTMCGTVDGHLHLGGLDVSRCGEMLSYATGQSVYDERGWPADFVRNLNERANWEFPIDENDGWAYWSAKKFLETCAKEGLSITFSW